MNNQKALNSVSLQEAASMISNALIKARDDLEKSKKQLFEDKKKYEEAYVLAYADGDASENAPLEAAIQNLKMVTGEIGSNARVLQIMDRLEDVEYLIGTYDFTDLETAIIKMPEEDKEQLFKAAGVTGTEALKEKLRNMSITEVAAVCKAYQSWIKAKYNIDEDDCLQSLAGFLSVVLMPRYNTCGIVVPYSTVRMEMNGKTMTYRIYPDGVAFIDIGVMAANARVARAIMGKQKGDSVSIRHDSTGVLLTYKIIDVY